MSKIGILGGTFDPIHKGHIKMAQLAKDALGLGRIILLPSGTPPHKPDAMSDRQSRLQMCALAAEENGFEVSDYEIKKDGASYTVHTLEHFKAQKPQDTLVFILGGDSLDYVEEWFDAQRLLNLCEIAAIPRRGVSREQMCELAQMLKEKYGAIVHLIDSEYIDISSTQVREAISMGMYDSSLLPMSVLQYIRENRLYRR